MREKTFRNRAIPGNESRGLCIKIRACASHNLDTILNYMPPELVSVQFKIRVKINEYFHADVYLTMFFTHEEL